ncbi:MAG: hypothetical protein JWM09_890 [Francisellaceae bacterium]|nr:hypothetical protein [Francisellaceae bacterium]
MSEEEYNLILQDYIKITEYLALPRLYRPSFYPEASIQDLKDFKIALKCLIDFYNKEENASENLQKSCEIFYNLFNKNLTFAPFYIGFIYHLYLNYCENSIPDYQHYSKEACKYFKIGAAFQDEKACDYFEFYYNQIHPEAIEDSWHCDESLENLIDPNVTVACELDQKVSHFYPDHPELKSLRLSIKLNDLHSEEQTFLLKVASDALQLNNDVALSLLESFVIKSIYEHFIYQRKNSSIDNLSIYILNLLFCCKISHQHFPSLIQDLIMGNKEKNLNKLNVHIPRLRPFRDYLQLPLYKTLSLKNSPSLKRTNQEGSIENNLNRKKQKLINT